MKEPSISTKRRQFLWNAASLLASAFVSTTPSFAQLQRNDSQTSQGVPSRDTMAKFFPNGSPRPFSGNTIICHLPQECAFRDAISAFALALHKSPFASKLAFTPETSYHMTVFAGAAEGGRSATSWPSYVPNDASIDQCNQMVGSRMKSFRLQCDLPLCMKLDQQATIQYRGAITLRMSPLNATEAEKLRHVRDRLADAYGFRANDHDRYAFHIGIAYRLLPFAEDETAMYQDIVQQHVRRIASSAEYLELGQPAFCTFHDMFRFSIQKILNT